MDPASPRRHDTPCENRSMTRPLKVGVQLPEVERIVRWAELAEMARTAEAIGLDSIWVGDHLLYRDRGPEPVAPWEAWSQLAALAAITTRVEIGPLVASTSFHNPAVLAAKANAVDEISGGRLILGLGAGWNEAEYRAFGFPFDQRVSRFEEAFTIVRTLLRDGYVDFGGHRRGFRAGLRSAGGAGEDPHDVRAARRRPRPARARPDHRRVHHRPGSDPRRARRLIPSGPHGAEQRCPPGQPASRPLRTPRGAGPHRRRRPRGARARGDAGRSCPRPPDHRQAGGRRAAGDHAAGRRGRGARRR